MKLLQFEISESLATRLEAEAERSGRSVNEVILAALGASLPAPAPPDGASFGDLASDVIGCGEGPEELSSNPEKMEGYGE